MAVDLVGFAGALGLGAARTMPVVWLVPAFGGRNAPISLRAVMGLGLAALCLPRLWGQLPGLRLALWTLLLVREVAVGLTLGFVASLVFRAAEGAGRLTDTLRGANFAGVISPAGGGRTSPLGQLNGLLATVLFLELGGLGQLALALSRSYDAVPVAAVVTSGQLGRVGALVLAASGQMIEAAVGLAAPSLVALLLADLVLGLLGRAVPALPLYFLGMPAKALLSVGVLLVSLAALDTALSAGFRGSIALVQRAIAAWQ